MLDTAILYYLDAGSPAVGSGAAEALPGPGAGDWRSPGGDFARIADLGISRVILADMLSLPETLAEEPERVLAALDAAWRAGLQAELLAFHPGLMFREELPLNFLAPEYRRHLLAHKYRMPLHPTHDGLADPRGELLVDNAGRIYSLYDVHNPAWQRRWLVPYLRGAAAAYGGHPAFAGLALAEVTLTPDPASYAAADAARFREFLEAKYGSVGALNEAWATRHAGFAEVEPPRAVLAWDPAWMDWREARGRWLVELGRTIREAAGRTPVSLSDTDFNITQAPTAIGEYSPPFVASFDRFSIEPLDLFAGGEAATLRSVRRNLALAAALLPGASGDGLRLRVCERARRPPPEPAELRAALDACVEAGASFIELAQYVTPYFPGELFRERAGMWRHPEVARAVKEFLRST